MERDDRRDSLDTELRERPAGALEGLLAGGAGDDQLGEHRVEGAGDLVPRAHAGVDAHSRTRGHVVAVDAAGGGHEATARILAVDAELEGVAARLGILGADGLAGGDAQLLAHQVHPRDLLGDGVLDLEASVHLEEGDGAVDPDEELAGAGAHVAGFAEDRLGGGDQLGVLLGREERRGRLLDELLVTTLQRAVAGGDHLHVAVDVRQALGLDVPGGVEVALHEALAAAEGGRGLAHRRVEQLAHLRLLASDLQPAAAAAERCLDRDREAVGTGEVDHLVRVLDRVLGACHQWGAGLLRDVAGRDLVAELLDGGRGRTDPGEPGVDDGLGEVGTLREEAVAGVDRIGAGALGDVEDLVDDQV